MALVASRQPIVGVATALALLTAAVQTGAQQSAASPASTEATKPPAAATDTKPKENPSVQECLDSHRDAQLNREQLRLLTSRQLLVNCGNAACPGLIRGDCLRWLGEVMAEVPSVVFHIDAGNGEQPNKVQIFVDGELRYQIVPLTPVELDPGRHSFRFVTEGRPEVDQDLMLGEGNKAVIVNVQFAPSSTAKGSAPAVGGGASTAALPPGSLPPQQQSAQTDRPVPLATYILGGVGIVAMANFVGWGLSSKSMYTDLEDSCAPNCAKDRIDKDRFRAQVADISLGVGVVSFAAAASFYFLRPTVESPVKVDVAALPHGGFLSTVQLHAF